MSATDTFASTGPTPRGLPLTTPTARQQVVLDDVFVRDVIAQHGMWKYRLHHAIETGTSAKSPDEIARDDRCSMGVWLHGAAHGDLPADVRQHLVALHRDFHRTAASVLADALEGRGEAARAALAPGSDFPRQSGRLIEAFLALTAHDAETVEEDVSTAPQLPAPGTVTQPGPVPWSEIALPLVPVAVVVLVVGWNDAWWMAALAAAALVATAVWLRAREQQQRRERPSGEQIVGALLRGDAGGLPASTAAQLADIEDWMSWVADRTREIAAAGSGLDPVLRELRATSEETAAQSQVASGAAAEVRAALEGVGAAAEEMAASIVEISASTSETAQLASAAAVTGQEGRETVRNLTEVSEAVGGILKIVAAIAEQTNLLALNATIEAARAGAAGKGFAVVANEVKSLAGETASAVADIHQRIADMEIQTGRVTEQVDHITTSLDEIAEQQQAIASAVEEQSATTNEISRNVHEAVSATSHVAENVDAVVLAASPTRVLLTEVMADLRRQRATCSGLAASLHRDRPA